MNKGCFWPNLRRAILAWNLMEAIEGQGGHQEVPLSKIFPPFFAAPAFFACQGRGRHLFESLVSLRYVSPLSLLAFQQSLKNASDILIEIRTLHHSNSGFLDFGWIVPQQRVCHLYFYFPALLQKDFSTLVVDATQRGASVHFSVQLRPSAVILQLIIAFTETSMWLNFSMG